MACQLDPWEGYHLSTLGTAQYRNAMYKEAQAALEELRGLMKDRSSDAKLQGFLREAEVLIGRR